MDAEYTKETPAKETPTGSKATENPEKPPRKQRRPIVRWLLLALAVTVLSVAGWKLVHGGKSKAPMMMPPGTQVSTTAARKGSLDVYLDSLGTVTAERTVSVYSQVSGRVSKVYYREGQTVKEGQPLVDIDSRPYEAQVLEAQGQLEHDQAELAQAHIDLNHYQDALKRNAIAKQTVEDEEQTVHQYEGTVKGDEGTLAYDRVELSYCHITAPISGRLGLRLVDPGNVVAASSSSTLVVITQENPTTVVFPVAQDHVPMVQKELSKRRTLRVDAYDRMQKNVLATGKLLSLDNEVDTTTGTVKFRAEFNNTAGVLFPNQFVNARLWVKTLNDALLAPTAAIQYNGQQPFLWIVQADGTVHVRKVQIGVSDDKESEVSGVSAGEAIVTNNFDRLQEGGKVMTGQPGAGAMGGPRP
jgi:multidrug efflux system membrane fusion protein